MVFFFLAGVDPEDMCVGGEAVSHDPSACIRATYPTSPIHVIPERHPRMRSQLVYYLVSTARATPFWDVIGFKHTWYGVILNSQSPFHPTQLFHNTQRSHLQSQIPAGQYSPPILPK